MSRFFLDITDSQIALIAGNAVIHSPGAALSGASSGIGSGVSSDGSSLTFGQAVFETLKRRPLETRTDFWAQLSTIHRGLIENVGRETVSLGVQIGRGHPLLESRRPQNRGR